MTATLSRLHTANRDPAWVYGLCAVLIALLAIAQLAVGTSLSFALAVAATLTVTLATVRAVGLSSIPGLLLTFMMVRYLIVSQLAKTVLGQPGNSNLAAPETTIRVILIGTVSMCAGILLVARLMKGRRLLVFAPSMPQLIGLRNLSAVVGGIAMTITVRESSTDFDTATYGGLGAIANEFSAFAYLAVMAETWLALTRSAGRRSTSPGVWAMVGALTIYGILSNSKQGIAAPMVAYLLASISFRRRLTLHQVIATAMAALIGTLVFYPINQLARGRLGMTGSTAEATAEEFAQLFRDPASLVVEWQLYKTVPFDQLSLQEQQLMYLGVGDDLAGRFLLIANTDTIVNAVNEMGPYGTDLITDGVLVAMPTLLMPDKPRIQTNDLLTWFYGLRPDVEEPGNPTIGLYADCYAALEWPGVIVLPFAMMIIFLPTLQLFGTQWVNNIVGTFLFFKYMQMFSEQQLEGFVGFSLRGVPFDILKIVTFIYIVNRYLSPRRGKLLRPKTLSE